MTLNMTQEKTRYDALGRLTAIEVGAVVGFAYGYVPMEDNIETMTFTHRANDPPYRNHRLTIRMRGR
jgi:hypothetical protein